MNAEFRDLARELQREANKELGIWDATHFKHGTRTLCNRAMPSLKVTNDPKEVTCGDCKALLEYQAKVEQTGQFPHDKSAELQYKGYNVNGKLGPGWPAIPRH